MIEYVYILDGGEVMEDKEKDVVKPATVEFDFNEDLPKEKSNEELLTKKNKEIEKDEEKLDKQKRINRILIVIIIILLLLLFSFPFTLKAMRNVLPDGWVDRLFPKVYVECDCPTNTCEPVHGVVPDDKEEEPEPEPEPQPEQPVPTRPSTIVQNPQITIKAQDLNIIFENVRMIDGSVNSPAPVLVNKTSITYNALLETPGDYYAYLVDIKNNGSYDAKVESYLTTVMTVEQAKYLSYSLTYEDGTPIMEGDLLPSGSKKTIKVITSFKEVEDIDSLDENITVSLVGKINYIQAD